MSAPPTAVKISDHIDPTPPSALFQSYHSQLESLQRLPVPYGEIYQALSISEHAPLPTLDTQYQKAALDITQWLEAAEMTVFGLEMDVEQDGNSSQRDVGNIEVIMNRFQPNIGMLLELRDKISQRLDKEEDKTVIDKGQIDQSTTQIQSSWTALKSLLNKVKDLLSETRTRGDLLTQMENIVIDIEEISAEIDVIQAQRSSPTRQSPDSTASRFLQMPASPPLVSSTSSLDTAITAAATVSGLGVSASSENLLTTSKDRNTDLLAHADSCIEALATRMEFLRVQIDISSSNISNSDPIREQHDHIQHMWGEMKARRDKVSDEIKESRWLAVFEQVAGQVESMMESTERAVIHCKGLVDQIKAMVRDKVIPAAPIDRDHLYTIFKSFEAKHKYYAPAVNKMLNMLQSGIESRMTKNTDVIGKHATMKQRWEKQRQELDRVEHDLGGIERLLDILDASIPSQTPAPPLQLPEKPIFAMRRSQTQPGWNSSGPQSQFQPPASQPPQQRGRRPAEESPARSRRLQSPSNPPPFTTNTRSRPWSPAPSVSSLPSLLSPNPSNNYRSLSKSPSRSPSRVANSDKLRPWCPSTTKTSPSIPGIPYSPSLASTFTPRSMSATGQSRATSPSPSPGPSRPTSSLSRTRSISCTPSLNRTPSQLKPTFAPAGSLSKLSTGVPRSSSPTPPPAAVTSTSTSLRRAQPKLPPPVVTHPTRMRQNSAPGTPMPQYSRRSSSPFSRDSSSSIAGSTTSSSSLSSARVPVFSPPAARIRQANAQSNRSASQSRLPPQHQQTNETLLTRTRRPSLGYTSSKSIRSVASSSLSSSSSTFGDRDTIDSAYGSVSGHLFHLDGPTSPTTSSSSVSSITSTHSSLSSSSSSFGRLRLSRFHQLQPQGYSPRLQNQQEEKLPELLDDLSIQVQDMAPYVPVRGSELDEEFAKIVNAHPIQMQVRRLGEGKYYFGGRMEETPGGSLTAVGGKMVLCRLMEFGRFGVAGSLSDDLATSPVDEEKMTMPLTGGFGGPRSRPSSIMSSRRSSVSSSTSDRGIRSRTGSLTGASGRGHKVMVRVGGGWQDLDIFLLDHSSLADETVVLRGLRS